MRRGEITRMRRRRNRRPTCPPPPMTKVTSLWFFFFTHLTRENFKRCTVLRSIYLSLPHFLVFLALFFSFHSLLQTWTVYGADPTGCTREIVVDLFSLCAPKKKKKMLSRNQKQKKKIIPGWMGAACSPLGKRLFCRVTKGQDNKDTNWFDSLFLLHVHPNKKNNTEKKADRIKQPGSRLAREPDGAPFANDK